MSLALQLKDYRLTTARNPTTTCRIIPASCRPTSGKSSTSHLGFPELRKFLDFWQISLDGKLHSVRVASANLIKPPSYRSPGAYLRLH